MKLEMVTAWGGMTMVRITTANSSPLPLKANRAKPYPTTQQDKVWNSVLNRSISTVLPNSFGNSMKSHTCRMLSSVRDFGIQMTTGSLSCAGGRKATLTAYSSGYSSTKLVSMRMTARTSDQQLRAAACRLKRLSSVIQ